jgi:outer membrane protein OmpA-like peptidoglycan-associated protein
MIRFLIGLSLALVWVFFARYYYLCKIKGQCAEPPVLALDSLHLQGRQYNLNLIAGDTFLIQEAQQFHFDFVSSAPLLSTENRDFIRQLANILETNPETQLQIIGHYTRHEAQTLSRRQGRFPNLGRSRALSLVDILHQEYKVPRERLFVKYELVEGDSLHQPLSFQLLGLRFAKLNQDSSFLQQVQTSVKRVTYTDLSANFDSGSKQFQPGPDFQVYVDSLKAHFDRHPRAYLLITGHTDSKGEAKYNQQLGLSRAQAVRDYLLRQGVKAKIQTQSKGESELLLPDVAEDGAFIEEAMAKNRRVQLEIKGQ